MINEFWKNWKNKTHVEKRAILSVKRAMDFLLTNVPKDKLISVYIKGTFVTRELKEKSDVDILPIVKNKSEMRKLKAVRDRNKERLRPSELLPMSYTELTQKNRPWGRADTFLRDLEHHKWLYGKKLKKSDYPMRTWDKMFLDEILMLKNKTIPLYRKGKFSFTQFIKQIFWISYSEQIMLGKSPPRTWKGLNKFIKDKKHIIHKVYFFRVHPMENKIEREKLISNSLVYLNSILKNNF